MIFRHQMIPLKYRGLTESILVLSGICMFALFIHKDTYIQFVSFAGLVITSVVMIGSVNNFSSLLTVFGIIPFGNKVISYSIAGILFGILLGLVHNFFYDEPLLPSSLTKFALIAPLIGIAEEMVFRGYVQTKTASFGAVFSIVFASFGHTIYKYFVLKTMAADLGIIFSELMLLTFLSGIVFGILRLRSKNVFPAAFAHALFDIVVYGGATVAPVWVWG